LLRRPVPAAAHRGEQRLADGVRVAIVVFAPAAAQAPPVSQTEAAVREAHAKYRSLQEGKNADYIPALAKVPANLFGIAVVDVNGRISTAGDVEWEFAIESLSKVFTLARVLEDGGEQTIENAMGVDATGQPFNSIVAIEKNQGREMNPFVNAGAIATTALVGGANADQVWAKIIGMHNDFAGRALSIKEEVYRSEADTNQRNQAIGMLMHAYGLFAADPAQATDLYTRQCSISANARDLAIMAATLANGGRNPVTRRQVIEQRHVKSILALMSTAGLYDESGKWLYRTGLPAKSGVGGGIIAVSPGKFGIAAFSPPLDAAGNSVRAQRAILDVSTRLGGNPYDVKPR
ncbi:MAG: glutaminase A, partial [Steroidobacteraceae bacterium]